jgi:hypothetical protein
MIGDAETGSPPEELRRSLSLVDAVVIGLGSMLGAGIFAAWHRLLKPPAPDSCWDWLSFAALLTLRSIS